MAEMNPKQLYRDPLPVMIASDGTSTTAVLSDPVAKTVSTTSQELAPARADRAGGLLTNVGSTIAYVRFGAAATTAAGGYHMALQPNSSTALPPRAVGSVNVVGSLLASSVVTLVDW